MTPPWLDQVLFDLQGLPPEKLSPWEREFLPSVSLQVGKHGRITDPQLRSLKRMYSRLFPGVNIESFRRFSEQAKEPPRVDIDWLAEKEKQLYLERLRIWPPEPDDEIPF